MECEGRIITATVAATTTVCLSATTISIAATAAVTFATQKYYFRFVTRNNNENTEI